MSLLGTPGVFVWYSHLAPPDNGQLLWLSGVETFFFNEVLIERPPRRDTWHMCKNIKVLGVH